MRGRVSDNGEYMMSIYDAILILATAAVLQLAALAIILAFLAPLSALADILIGQRRSDEAGRALERLRSERRRMEDSISAIADYARHQ